MRQFSRISDGRVNVFRLKRRIAFEDLLPAGPFGKNVEDVRDETRVPLAQSWPWQISGSLLRHCRQSIMVWPPFSTDSVA